MINQQQLPILLRCRRRPVRYWGEISAPFFHDGHFDLLLRQNEDLDSLQNPLTARQEEQSTCVQLPSMSMWSKTRPFIGSAGPYPQYAMPPTLPRQTSPHLSKLIPLTSNPCFPQFNLFSPELPSCKHPPLTSTSPNTSPRHPTPHLSRLIPFYPKSTPSPNYITSRKLSSRNTFLLR